MILLWVMLLIGPYITDGETGAGSASPRISTETPEALNDTGTASETTSDSWESGGEPERSNTTESTGQNVAGSYGQNLTDQTWQNSSASSGQNISDSTELNVTETARQSSTEAPGQNSTETTGQNSTETVGQNSTETTGQNSTESTSRNSTETGMSDTTEALNENVTDTDNDDSSRTTISPGREATTKVMNETKTLNESTEAIPENTTSQLNTTDVVTDLATSTQSHIIGDRTWMKTFLSIKHFDGWYSYNGGHFVFDFVARFVHPTNSQTLVATFYDEDGAVLDMNGTSTDGHTVIFTSSTIYSKSYRFSENMVLQINGTFVDKGDDSVYSGRISLPLNSSFEMFHMQKGIDKPESVDDRTSRTAAIIAVVACISFIVVLGTVSFVCWAVKNGYLQKQHKHYRLFRDSAVAYETDAETVHI